jgi:hypothetical protein
VTGIRKPIPLYYWAVWMATLAAALVVFYVFLTPLWMGIRALAWLSERGSRLGRSREATRS